jgi:hypothetical protein
MAKEGGFSLCDIPLREKVVYEGYMQMNPKYPSPYPESKKEEVPHAATDLEKLNDEPPEEPEEQAFASGNKLNK